MSATMWSTVFGASFGYVSTSKVPFAVSTTKTGPAPGDLGALAGADGAGLAGGFAACADRFTTAAATTTMIRMPRLMLRSFSGLQFLDKRRRGRNPRTAGRSDGRRSAPT